MPSEPALRSLLERTNPWLSEVGALARHARRRLPETYLRRAIEPQLAEAFGDTRHAPLPVELLPEALDEL